MSTSIIRIFFDVDNTILTWDKRLRPFTRDVMARLKESGFEIHVWSGVGRRREVLDVHRLWHLVSGCYEKPLSRHRDRVRELGIPWAPDYVVDDDEEIVSVFGGIVVAPPCEPLEDDRELLRVLDDVSARYIGRGAK